MSGLPIFAFPEPSGPQLSAGLFVIDVSSTTNFRVPFTQLAAAIAVGGAAINFSAGTTSANLQSVVFGDANGVSFGLNGGTITASAAPAAPAGSISAGTTNATLGQVEFSNANGISFGVNGQTVTASHNALTSQSNQALSGSNGSFTFQTATFGNLNGMSFYTSNGSLVGSYTVPSIPSLTPYFSNTNTTFNGTNISGSLTHNTDGLRVDLSVAAPGGGGAVNFSAGTTSNNLQSVVFSNSNGFSFGLDGSTITGAYTVPTQSVQPGIQSISAGTTRITTGEAVFSNSNGISFGVNGQTITGSHNGLTSQSNQAASGQNGSFTFQTLGFSNANGISFGTSAGNSITASHNGLTSQSNQALSGSNGSFTFQTATFGNLNGFSFYTSNGSLVGSYTVPSVPSVTQYFSNTATTFNGTNISGSLTINTNGLRVDLSVAAPGAAAEANWHHLLGANTSGNTTASGSTIGFSGINLTLSGTNGSVINFSAPPTSSLSAITNITIGTTGSTIGFSVGAGGGGGGFTAPGYHPYDDLVQIVAQVGQGSLIIDPQNLPNISFDRLVLGLQNTNSSNSSGSHTLRFSVGLYTRDASRLSLFTSFTGSTAVTHSGTAGSYSWYSGNRMFPITFGATSIPENRYWIAFISSTSTAGANGSYSNMLVSNISSNFSGQFGTATNATKQPRLGQGFYSASTTAFPASIAFSQINGTHASARRFPVIGFGSSTY